MRWFSRSSKAEAQEAQASPLSPEALCAITDLRGKYPVEVRQDPMSQETNILVEPITGALVLSLTINYTFPAAAPEVRVVNVSGDYLAGLEGIARCGLMDADTGAIQYRRCFGWHPTMEVSTLVFLICLMVRTANELTGREHAKGGQVASTAVSSSPSQSSPSLEGADDVVVE